MQVITSVHSVNHIPFVLTQSAGLSVFQTSYAIKVSESPDFDFWCRIPMVQDVRRGPTMFTYYTKDGRLHGDRVGVDRIICCVTSQ